MKKISILIVLVCLLNFVSVKAQVTLNASFDFENGVSNGWTSVYGGSSTDITMEENEDIAINGKKYLRIKKNGTESIYVQSELITVEEGKSVRIEFNHIPMIDRQARVQLLLDGTTSTIALNGNNVYDNKFRPDLAGRNGASFIASTYYSIKDITKVSSINSSMWRHEVFYLTNKLSGSVKFRIRFMINSGKDDGYGWLIDDFKVYTAPLTDGVIPRFEKIVTCPNVRNYPYCNDADIEFKITDTDLGLSTIADSLYVAYYTEGDKTVKRVKLESKGENYAANIPYAGIDSNVYWKAVITDRNGNQTSYPYTGEYYKFKYVRPYAGSDPIKQNATTSEALIFATSKAKVSHQIRYSATELRAAGYTAGIIDGFYFNVLTRPSTVPTLSNFKVYIGAVSSDYILDESAQYSGVENVFNRVEYIVPEIGWNLLQFDNDATFIWDGESDIIIKTCFENSRTFGETKISSYSAGSDVQYKTMQLAQDANSTMTACNDPFNTDNTGTIGSKPNLRFNFINKCYFQTDAGIRKDTLLSPMPAKDCNGNLSKTYVCKSYENTTLRVMLRNDGTSTLSKVKVKWMLDDDIENIDSSTWTGTMRPLDSSMLPQDTATVFTATTRFKASTGVHELKIWTEITDPSITDWNHDNDTAVFKLYTIDDETRMRGDYAIGGSIAQIPRRRTFQTFEEAFIMLINAGVRGACTFKIYSSDKDTTYAGSIAFPTCIEGLSETNTLTFVNENTNNEVVFAPSLASDKNIFDLSSSKYLSFKNLTFSLDPQLTGLTFDKFDFVKLNGQSSHITFDSCKFLSYAKTTKYYSKVASLINMANASNITINACTFDTPAKSLVRIEGTSSARALDNKISKSTFNIVVDQDQNIVENALSATYVSELTVTENSFITPMDESSYEKLTSVYYALQLNDLDWPYISKNTFKLHALSAMTLSSCEMSTIANNMLSLDNINTSAGTYNQYGIYLQSGRYNTIAYNNLYSRGLKNSSKRAYGFALGTASSSLERNLVKNNILVSDGYGYAVFLRNTSNDAFEFSNNLYYKKQSLPNIPLFSYDGATNTTIEDWKESTKEQNSFYNEDPAFAGWDNLYSTNITLCENGDWVSDITDDFFGNQRPTKTEKRPCIGAREFPPPPNNIYVLRTGLADFDPTSGDTYSDCNLAEETIFVEFKNVSSNTISANSVKFNYSVNGNTSTSTVGTFGEQIIPNEIYRFNFPVPHNFAAIDGNKNFEIKAFSIFDLDTVKNNDTASAKIISYYRLPGLAEQGISVKYGNPANLDVTNLCANDSVYWFYNENDEEAFHKGHTLTTDNLYSDSTLYFARREEVPLVRISEIQYSKDATKMGITPNLPNYVSENNAFEISNFGSEDLPLGNYKFVYYNATNIKNATATYTFPSDYVLKGHSAIVLVAANNLTVGDSIALAIDASKFKPSATTKCGFAILNSNGEFIDALTVNGAKFDASVKVPASVWQDSDKVITVTTAVAGIIRTNITSANSDGWIVADEFNVMSMGTYNETLTDQNENLCLGHKTPYSIKITDIPDYDPGITLLNVDTMTCTSSENGKEFELCNLTSVNVDVILSNTGLQDLDTIPVICLLYENGQVIDSVYEEYTTTLEIGKSADYTFSTPLDLTANDKNRDLLIKVYTARADDIVHNNDTLYLRILSMHTPLPPTTDVVEVEYAQSATLNATSENIIIWYEDATTTEELGRGSVYHTSPIYEDTVFYVGAFIEKSHSMTIGYNPVVVTNTNPSPSLLNARTKNVKEQYLIPADTLLALGFAEGNIKGLSINIQSVTPPSQQTEVKYTDFNLKIGTTEQHELLQWENNLKTVYSTDTLTIHKDAKNVWRQIQFDESFYWDGISNIIIDVCFSVDKTGSVFTKTVATQYVSALSYKSSNNSVCDYNSNSSKYSYSKIPYISLDMDVFGCYSERVPVKVNAKNVPSCDMGIVDIIKPIDNNIVSGEKTEVAVSIKNYGTDAMSSATIKWKINDVEQSPIDWVTTTPLQKNETAEVDLGEHIFNSGKIVIDVEIAVDCDTTSGNDTFSKTFAACLGKENSITKLTIGSGNSDYSTLSEVLDMLEISGVCGPIEILVKEGQYNEVLNIPYIRGMSDINTIKFIGEGEAKTIITYMPFSDDPQPPKVLLELDNTSHISFSNMTFRVDGTFSHIATLQDVSNIEFRNVAFETSAKTNPTTDLINISGLVNNISFVSDMFLNGNNAIITARQKVGQLSNFKIDSCLFKDFKSTAVSINDYENVSFAHNKIISHANDYIADALIFNNISGVSNITSNEIILSDGTNKARNAVVIRRASFDDTNPLLIANNAIAIIGSGKVKAYGIDIDSSNFVGIYYNTIALKVGASNNTSRCLFVGAGNTNISVRNNNLDNDCGGHAYYVDKPGTQVVVSDNNNYKTNSTRLVYWTKECATIDALRTTNKFDEKSISVENKFKADTNLEFLYPTDIVRKAESLEDISVDILGYNRPVSPQPTIGAYEYQFSEKDAGIVRIESPTNKTSYIEGDDIDIECVIKNFGSDGIYKVDITTVLRGHEGANDIFQTETETYSEFLSSLDTVVYKFSKKLKAVLNNPPSDSLYVQVYTTLTGDNINYNDTMSLCIKVIPGKDVVCTATKKQNANIRCGRDVRKQVVEATIRNVGNRAVASTDVINVTYEVVGKEGQLKARETEQIRFPYTYTNATGNIVTLPDLQPNATIQYYAFNKTVNLESTNAKDTTWKIRVYVTLNGDNNKLNDTSAYEEYKVIASPQKPVAHDTTIFYGTYASVRSTQKDELPIKWYHDTTDADAFYKPAKYDASTKLDITVPLYNDTMFYTMVRSTDNNACQSDFTPVKVTVRPRCASDVVALEITAPPAQPKKGYIYMNEDTVKVKLTNYGTQAQTGFNIVCSLKPTVPSDADAVIFREVCDATIQTDDTIEYTFKHLFDFTNDTTTYEVKVWTENNRDCTRSNDTTEAIKVIPLFEMDNDAVAVSNATSLDITRVQLATMDNMSAALSDRYSDYTETVTPPELFKGLKDSLLISIAPASDMTIDEDAVLTGWVKAWIDWNRDGRFDAIDELVYSDAAQIGDINRTLITVPEDARSGYTRMRIIVSQNDETHTFGPNPGNGTYSVISAGEIEDYKIHVAPIKDVNAELVRFVSPQRQDTITKSALVVRLRNAGKTDLTSAKITWIYNTDTTEFEWTGTLASSEIEDVILTELDLNIGYNHFKAYIDVEGEEYRPNDTITLDNYTYHIYTIPYTTSFDESGNRNSDFYAYEADPRKPSNLWQMGTPSTTANKVITKANSAPTCWKTNINGQYTMNNTSILYTPIFDISGVKPDTVSFMLRRDMGPGASMTVEYLNYKNVWTVLGKVNDANAENWYDSEDGFTKTNVTWERASYSIDAINGELGKQVQFRFVFTSRDGRIADGVAIDDFKIERALRDLDAGVTKIILTDGEDLADESYLPSYGQYFYPKVTVHNFGKKPLTSFRVCYLTEDMYIPQCEDVIANIPVAGDMEYVFKNGRYLNITMPDPFSITAYTRLNPEDLYTDNDTARAYFVIGPLVKDVGLLEITEPLAKVASNDNISVAIKVKNYGLDPVEDLPVYYSAGSGDVVKETIHFNPPLNNGDEYVYTFRTTYRTSFGTVNLKSWVGLLEDTYPDNDTVYKRIQSSNSAVDLEAKYITLDDARYSDFGLQIAVLNRSSKEIKDIVVGYYLNGDKTDVVEETFKGGDGLIAGTIGYHTFARRINRNIYQSVCAYVRYAADEDNSNDTTCLVYLGYRDLQADSILVEQNVNTTCKVQLIAHHAGTLAGNKLIKAAYVVDGNYANIVRENFNLAFDEPDGHRLELTFKQGVQRRDDGQYNITAWVEYEGDNNKSNDTTKYVKVQTYVGIETIDGEENSNDFVVKQNVPNPFIEQTSVEIYLPIDGEVRLDVTDNNGRVVYTYSQNLSSGMHYITLPLNAIPSGTYYYTVRYNDKRIAKKMIKLQ